MHTFPNSCGGNLNHYKCSPANVSVLPPSLTRATSAGWKDKYGLPSISSALQCWRNVFQSNPHEEIIQVDLGFTPEIHILYHWIRKHYKSYSLVCWMQFRPMWRNMWAFIYWPNGSMRSRIRHAKQHYVDSLAARPVSRTSQHYSDRGLGYAQKILCLEPSWLCEKVWFKKNLWKMMQ